MSEIYLEEGQSTYTPDDNHHNEATTLSVLLARNNLRSFELRYVSSEIVCIALADELEQDFKTFRFVYNSGSISVSLSFAPIVDFSGNEFRIYFV